MAFAIGFSLSEISKVYYFVVREEELARIYKVLGKGASKRVAVVQGLGRIGKTQLVVAYAKRHWGNYLAMF